MKVETLKKRLIALVIHENLSLALSEEEMRSALRKALGKRAERQITWSQDPPFTLEAGKTIIPKFVVIPKDVPLASLTGLPGHPFGYGPNESQDQVMALLKWAICLVSEKFASHTMWDVYRLFPETDVEETLRETLPTQPWAVHDYDIGREVLALLTFEEWREVKNSYAKEHGGKDPYGAFLNRAHYIVDLLGPQGARRCINHLLDFGVPGILQSLAVATGATMAGELFGQNPLEDCVEFLLSLEGFLRKGTLVFDEEDFSKSAFSSFSNFYSLYANKVGIEVSIEDLYGISQRKDGVLLPFVSDYFNTYTTLPPACLRTKGNVPEQLFFLFCRVIDKNDPLRSARIARAFFETIFVGQERADFIDPVRLAKALASVGVSVKLASSEVLGISELEIPSCMFGNLLRIFSPDGENQVITWASDESALIRGEIEGFSSVKFYKHNFEADV